MGWKRELNRLAAAQRQADRQKQVARNKVNRTADSELRRIDQCADRALRQVFSAIDKIEKDPISALNVSYSLGGGFSFDPIEIDADIFSGKIDISDDDPESHPKWIFIPDGLKDDNFRVSVLDATPSRMGTFVAFYVENLDEEYRIRLNWMKKSDPQTSPVYLIDHISNEYYYPIASGFRGEVVAGHPRIGVLAFERFRFPTDKFSLHFSDVKLTSERGKKYTFEITCSGSGLRSIIADQLSASNLKNDAEKRIEELRKELFDKVHRLRSKSLQSASGCLIAIAVPVSALVALYLLF